VVMAVIVMHARLVVLELAAARAVAVEEFEALGNLLALVDAGAEEGDDAGRGAGETGVAAERRLIAEATGPGVWAALDVFDALVGGALRYGDAGVARRP